MGDRGREGAAKRKWDARQRRIAIDSKIRSLECTIADLRIEVDAGPRADLNDALDMIDDLRGLIAEAFADGWHDSVIPREVVALEDAIRDTVVAALDAGVSADRIVSVVARALVPDDSGHGRGCPWRGAQYPGRDPDTGRRPEPGGR